MPKRSKKKKRPDVIQGGISVPKEIPPGKPSAVPWRTVIQALVIAAVVFWIYWPALHGDWLWDDDQLVTDNAVVRDPSGLWKIWFDPGTLLDYQPLKFSFVWLQWQFLGDHTLGYHLCNVLLHILGALLVWRLFSKFGLRLAWLGGLIFAVHPVQVESVAWIAELKNTLSLPPLLLAICAWIDFEERGKKRDYFLALGLFLVAMLCKPAMVMFPLVILLYAWWKRRQITWSDVGTGVPFFLISLVLGLVTIWFLHHNALENSPAPARSFFSKLACAGLSISFYFSKCFLPVGLLPIYPQWVIAPPTLAQFLPWPILGAVIFWLWTKRDGWGRHALLGLGFFLINLAPFVGFNTAAYMFFTWVMNYLLYIPIIGLIGLVVAGLGRTASLLPATFRPCGIALAVVVLALLAFQSRSYAKNFINGEALWTYELRHNPEAWLAHLNLGVAFFRQRRVQNAIQQYEVALQLKPDYPTAYDNLGFALMKSGRVSEAIPQFEQALRCDPDYAFAHHNLGVALLKTGHVPEAIEHFERAIAIDSDYPEAHDNLGVALLQTGHVPEAIAQFEEAQRIKPDYTDAFYNLGNALQQSGRPNEAIEQFEQALKIEPDYAEAHNNLGSALFQVGRIPEAIDHYEQSLRIDPNNASACYNLGVALLKTGRMPEAMEQFEQALRIKPDYAEAHNNLGTVFWRLGRKPEAIAQFESSLQINPRDAGTHFNLAYTLQQTGRVPEAIEQYKETLQLNPGYTAAQKNLAGLQALSNHPQSKP